VPQPAQGHREEHGGEILRQKKAARQDARIAVMDPANVFNPVYVAILLHREDQTLLNYLNIWIDQIEMDGTLAKIRAKWLGDVR